ncbi:hypothetical protein [Streptomyces massasporeus]|uniref:hypothetical protein n=1 Tax=Streptomyces massasporeus TaxID=67324 RepID=UPI001678EE88|nr:hypothetical protein [Streptomyces massasporeus]GGV72990.1 hypothetical protein GCM10010228_33350 [Streptomyces massasporeus]
MRRHARGRSRDSRKTRFLALAGVVAACAIALPLAAASAGSSGSAGPKGAAGSKRAVGSAGSKGAVGSVGAADSMGADARASGSGAPRPSARADDKAPGAPEPSAVAALPALGQGLSTAVRCGPELTSPDGIEAQTCVVTQGAQTWARTYYRNATGEPLDAVLSLMGPDDRNVRMTCAVGAEDEPGTCETPREPARGNPAAYTAVAEFAERGGLGPLLLRSGSNSPVGTGS